jgi:hypothetical protein
MRCLRLLLPFLIASLAGCGTSLPPETDPAKGREALQLVLEAWKAGTSLDDFRKQNSIVTWDPDWEAGHKLAKYELSPADKRSGVDLQVSVTLTIIGEGGKSRDRTVNFNIGIGAQTVVLRQV